MFTTAQIAEALNTVLEIDGDDTPRVAFFGYAGHTKGLQIDVYVDGWADGKSDYYSYLSYADLDVHRKTIWHDKKGTDIEFDNFDQMLNDARRVGL